MKLANLLGDEIAAIYCLGEFSLNHLMKQNKTN